jgi:hypothetical protein
MTPMEASGSFPAQTWKEGASAVERSRTVVKEPAEESGFIRICRFMENCDGLLKGDGCPTCDFVRGVVQDYMD